MSTCQRQSYRCRSQHEGTRAVLNVRGRKVVVDLLDQSTGGFAVLATKPIRARTGERILIRTAAGWSEVSVVHVDRENSATRIGLERLSELADPRDARSLHCSSLPGVALGKHLHAGNLLANTLTILLVITVGFWLVTSRDAWLPKVQAWWTQPTSSGRITNNTASTADQF